MSLTSALSSPVDQLVRTRSRCFRRAAAPRCRPGAALLMSIATLFSAAGLLQAASAAAAIRAMRSLVASRIGEARHWVAFGSHQLLAFCSSSASNLVHVWPSPVKAKVAADRCSGLVWRVGLGHSARIRRSSSFAGADDQQPLGVAAVEVQSPGASPQRPCSAAGMSRGDGRVRRSDVASLRVGSGAARSVALGTASLIAGSPAVLFASIVDRIAPAARDHGQQCGAAESQGRWRGACCSNAC